MAKAQDKNTIDCRVLRVIEDNFSTMAVLKPEGASNIADYSKILWEMDKATCQIVKDGLGIITITLEAGHIMLLD